MDKMFKLKNKFFSFFLLFPHIALLAISYVSYLALSVSCLFIIGTHIIEIKH